MRDPADLDKKDAPGPIKGKETAPKPASAPKGNTHKAYSGGPKPKAHNVLRFDGHSDGPGGSTKLDLTPVGTDDHVATAPSLSLAPVSCESAKSQTTIDKIEVVKLSFGWLNDAAQQQIEALRVSLKKGDEPPWQEKLGEAILGVALAAGAAAGGEFIAGALVVAEGEDVLKEFVKTIFEEGINAGVDAGKTKLGGDGSDAFDPFIESQKEGVRGMQLENQTDFIMNGQHRVSSVEHIDALKAACSKANVDKAAVQQVNATRDAWVSYLAQVKFGSTSHNEFAIPGEATTNMSTQNERDLELRHNPFMDRDLPATAPSIDEAALGHAAGVLTVVAQLPEISNGRMQGKPEVTIAFLNGLNEENRNKYVGRLANAKIPRQVNARVGGKIGGFSLNIDESGKARAEQTHGNPWLLARGEIGNTSLTYDERDLERRGLEGLLLDLNVTDIKDKVPLV